ncbi:MAG: anti-sigma factor [Ilumatobacteraceae bacterium]
MTTDLHHLSAAYALDALDTAERTEFEAHLSSCAECTAEVAGFVEVVGNLAETSSAAPPMRLKSSVMAKLSGIEQVAPPEQAAAPVIRLDERRRRLSTVSRVLAAAAAVAILAIGALVVSGTRGGSEYDDVIAAADAEVVQLAGETGTVEVVWSPGRHQVALRGDGLADLDPTLKYALWAIADGTSIPAGLFDAEGGVIRDVADIGDINPQEWGITIEPAAGSQIATTPVIYRSS